jgi:hypothetical protein
MRRKYPGIEAGLGAVREPLQWIISPVIWWEENICCPENFERLMGRAAARPYNPQLHFPPLN